ncbi:tetratricopeptide repeat-containing sensor histidine kinase [Spirosoma endbachense]|uniref:histidine kinase n=1 Tax=Spirosoma endbachense TaxID=2666025 RepID=A0A6P1VXZ8_9BACT|nr:tetratricopeptide repeat protein [Spirosoma endbachense]QHV96700.1 tetratricopeptide repeat protein [Spirosoma endbachense]
MLRLLLICVLLNLPHGVAFAQAKVGQARLDSLLAELPRVKPDTNRVKLLNGIGNEYLNSNLNEGINYASQALALAQRLTWKKGIAAAYTRLGNLYFTKSDYPQALTAYLSGLRMAEELKDKNRISTITGNVGGIYFLMANYPKALAYFGKALKGAKELGNKRGVFLWQGNIGNVYSEQGEFAKALDYQLKSLKLLEDIGFQRLDKENIFNDLGQTYLNLANYPQALSYLQNGLNLSKATGNKAILIRVYSNLSKLNFKIATDSNATSLTTLQKSSKTHTLQNANAYADSAVVLAKERGDLPYLYQAYQIRSQVQDALGEPQAAFASFKDFIKTKDLVINQQNANKIAVATLQYEFDKKETALHFEQQLTAAQLQKQIQQRTYLLYGVGMLVALLGLIVYGYTQKQKANLILYQQKEEINIQRTKAENALIELRATQTQLIQKEKMASLGELTAGIAHEIQNPLNFVNNFSEVSAELVTELEEEQQRADRDTKLEAEILVDLKQNLQKINHHGGRASAIVKGMLEHSRTDTGEKHPTDLNVLADEYLKLAYHGLKAKDKEFNAELVTDFEPDSGLLEVVPQEIGRVLLNLYNNAFYAVKDKQLTASPDYQPTVRVSTRQLNGYTEIRVSDNGTGILDTLKGKIFQPFFTTKPTGEGTGLGLSLSYDIVTKGHGGSLTVESLEGESTEFVIQLPALSQASVLSQKTPNYLRQYMNISSSHFGGF